MVRTGLERHIGCRAFRIAIDRGQRIDLRMRFARLAMPALTYDFPVTDDDATHARIWMRRVTAARRELQGARHETAIRFIEAHFDIIRHGHTPGPVLPDAYFFPSNSGNNDICSRLADSSEISCRRWISSWNSVTSWKRRYTDANRT